MTAAGLCAGCAALAALAVVIAVQEWRDAGRRIRAAIDDVRSGGWMDLCDACGVTRPHHHATPGGTVTLTCPCGCAYAIPPHGAPSCDRCAAHEALDEAEAAARRVLP